MSRHLQSYFANKKFSTLSCFLILKKMFQDFEYGKKSDHMQMTSMDLFSNNMAYSRDHTV